MDYKRESNESNYLWLIRLIQVDAPEKIREEVKELLAFERLQLQQQQQQQHGNFPSHNNINNYYLILMYIFKLILYFFNPVLCDFRQIFNRSSKWSTNRSPREINESTNRNPREINERTNGSPREINESTNRSP